MAQVREDVWAGTEPCPGVAEHHQKVMETGVQTWQPTGCVCVSGGIYHISPFYCNEWGLEEVIMLHINNKNNRRDGT